MPLSAYNASASVFQNWVAPSSVVGSWSSRFFLQPSAGLSAAAASDPKVAPLLATQSKLQFQLDSLRMAKGKMKEEEYEKALEDVLTKIAENASALRALGVRKP